MVRLLVRISKASGQGLRFPSCSISLKPDINKHVNKQEDISVHYFKVSDLNYSLKRGLENSNNQNRKKEYICWIK